MQTIRETLAKCLPQVDPRKLKSIRFVEFSMARSHQELDLTTGQDTSGLIDECDYYYEFEDVDGNKYRISSGQFDHDRMSHLGSIFVLLINSNLFGSEDLKGRVLDTKIEIQ